MATLILPREVTEHLEAAIELSNRRVHLRFLDEAEALIALNLPTAAVMVAGVVLESILAGVREEEAFQDRQQINEWFELRNEVVHAHATTVTLDQAKRMVEDARRFLTRETKVGLHLTASKTLAPRQIQGKYRFVPTSSAEFISRKADELRLEHDEGGS
jgi:hypothetical protein